MVIAMDIDGTITRHPGFFGFLSRMLVNAGHQVIVITFRENPVATRQDLDGWGVAYTRLITWGPQAMQRFNREMWKATMCRRYAVEVFFEDDPAVLAHVAPEVLCLMPTERAQVLQLSQTMRGVLARL